MTDADSSQALDDAIRVQRMALDAGPNADRNLGALAREVPRTQRRLHMLDNRLYPPSEGSLSVPFHGRQAAETPASAAKQELPPSGGSASVRDARARQRAC